MIVRTLSITRKVLKKTGLLQVVKRSLYRPSAADGGRSSTRGLRYRIKLLIEQANYAANEAVHDLPPIYLYWARKHLQPMFLEFGFRDIGEFLANEAAEALGRRPGPHRLLSIGSGNCDVEIALAQALRDRGFGDFEIDCMDINASMLARGADLAEAHGVAPFLKPLKEDFNTWDSAGPTYTVVVAHQSLHHVVNLEGLLDSIRRSLLPEGVFVTSDMIGRNGHMRWPEALALVNAFWPQLPPSYRYNHLFGHATDEYVNLDCSKAGFEGIRAQDILPLLVEKFAFKTFIPFANVVDAFIDRGIGPNFDPGREWDRAFIDGVAAADVAALEDGRVKPTHLVAAMTALPVFPMRYPGKLTPEFCLRRP